MRSLTSSLLAAIRQPVVVTRDFIWIIARNRSTGAPAPQGFWSDVGTVQAEVIDPFDGTVTRAFAGSSIQGVGEIALTTGLTVDPVRIELSAIEPVAAGLIRVSECRGAPVRIWRGFFNPLTHRLIDPAPPRFVGFCDHAKISEGKEGDVASIALECVPTVEELRRESGFVRSLADQARRDPLDDFHRDVERMAEQELFWGKDRVRPAKGGASGDGGNETVGGS